MVKTKDCIRRRVLRRELATAGLAIVAASFVSGLAWGFNLWQAIVMWVGVALYVWMRRNR